MAHITGLAYGLGPYGAGPILVAMGHMAYGQRNYIALWSW